jgi:hypothetical protein
MSDEVSFIEKLRACFSDWTISDLEVKVSFSPYYTSVPSQPHQIIMTTNSTTQVTVKRIIPIDPMEHSYTNQFPVITDPNHPMYGHYYAGNSTLYPNHQYNSHTYPNQYGRHINMTYNNMLSDIPSEFSKNVRGCSFDTDNAMLAGHVINYEFVFYADELDKTVDKIYRKIQEAEFDKLLEQQLSGNLEDGNNKS